MSDYLTPIVSVEDVANAFRYDETEYPYIEMLILSAQRYLYNAGAFSPSDKRTEDAIYTYVGISLENRDGMGYDYKNTEHLSSSLTSLINSLRHTPNVPIKQPPSEVSDNA